MRARFQKPSSTAPSEDRSSAPPDNRARGDVRGGDRQAFPGSQADQAGGGETAVRDSVSGRGVSFLAIVSNTFRPEINPPAAIAMATIRKPKLIRFGNASSESAAIFGVSFQPRAKLISPPLAQWIAFAAGDTICVCVTRRLRRQSR